MKKRHLGTGIAELYSLRSSWRWYSGARSPSRRSCWVRYLRRVRPGPVRQPTSVVTTTVPSTLVAAANGFAAAVQVGALNGDLSTGVAQQIDSLVQAVETSAVAGPGAPQIASFDQLVQTIAADEASGMISGATTITALSAAASQMATALQTTVPIPTTLPFLPGGNGQGRGRGNGGH